MKRFKSMSLAILGSGWSGSGAMVELLKSQSGATGYPFELDFWRRPNGLHNIKNQREMLIFFGNEIFSTIKIISKTIVKIIFQPIRIKTHLKLIFLQFKMFFLMLSFFLASMFSSKVKFIKKSFIKMFKLFFGKKGSVFIYDQAVFLEQIDDPVLGDLEVDAIIVVLRDVFDQAQDLLNNASFLNVNTIRESFFLGAEGDLDSNQNSSQLHLILLTLRHRVRRIIELVDKYPDSIFILKFENLIEDTKEVVSNVNRFLELKGFPPSFIDYNNAKDFLATSKKNIGIGKQTQWKFLSLMEEINNDINFLFEKNK